MFNIRLVQGGYQEDAEMEAVPRVGDNILRGVGGKMMGALVESVTWELSAYGPGCRVVYVRLGPDQEWMNAGSA